MPTTDHTPRLKAAEAAGDAFLKRLQQELPEATEIAEFHEFRAALSDLARAAFDGEWETEIAYNLGPQTWEMALAIRDADTAMISARERNALRRHIARLCADEGYPIMGPDNDDRYEFGAYNAGSQELLAEADQLSELSARARRLEEMLREHAAKAGQA